MNSIQEESTPFFVFALLCVIWEYFCRQSENLLSKLTLNLSVLSTVCLPTSYLSTVKTETIQAKLNRN